MLSCLPLALTPQNKASPFGFIDPDTREAWIYMRSSDFSSHKGAVFDHSPPGVQAPEECVHTQQPQGWRAPQQVQAAALSVLFTHQ